MPNDYITLNALAQEINLQISDCRIDKVNMPEKDEINLMIRRPDCNAMLTISCNANNPRMHLGGDKKVNPLAAPSFCMHLRKHIAGGVINSVKTLGEDRIVCFEITSRNEMRDKVKFALIAEMMGRYSNILLVKENGTISDTLKQVSYDTLTKRCLLPGAKYSLPPQSKLLPSQSDEIINALNSYNGADLAKFIISNVSGLALITAKQIARECGLDDSSRALEEKDRRNIAAKICKYADIYNSGEYSPCALEENGRYCDFFVTRYDEYQNLTNVESLNQAVLLCTLEKDRTERRAERTKFLQKAFNSHKKKLLSKLAKNGEKLVECQQTDDMKKYADLIISNAYAINKGDKVALVADYYQADCPQIKIQLDEKLTPQQNSQLYYKKYAKLKRTAEAVTKQISQLEEELQYLESIAPALDICSSGDEIAELQQELTSLGALRKVKNDKSKHKASQPIAYELDEFAIIVGKNNIQNDKLTFKLANGSDMWIHTQKYHGSHVIVFAEGREIPDNVIETACEIAAFYSMGKKDDGSKIECDYTQRRNLKRHPSGKPGMVVYSAYKTARVSPAEHKDLLV